MSSWPKTRDSLIRRLADPADAAAWEEFERDYRPTIYRYVRSRGLQASDAMDAVQEVLLAVHRQAATWTPSAQTGSFRSWLAETGRRTTLHHFRSRQRMKTENTAFHEALERSQVDGDQARFDDEERDWMFCRASALVEQSVSPTQWKAFWRTAVDGTPPRDVATELEMKIGAVYTAKSRIQSKIKQAIEALRAKTGGE